MTPQELMEALDTVDRGVLLMFASLVGGPILTYITQAFKSLTGISGKYAILITGLIIGVLFVVITNTLTLESIGRIMSYISTTVGVAMMFYNIVIKKDDAQ